MSVRSGQSVTTIFPTSRFDTGAATNADSLPGGTLYVNGTADAASVTVTNITTGLYKAAVTLPTLAVGDVVGIVIAATVNSVAGKGKVWEDTKDVFAGAIPDAAANANGGLPVLSSSGTTLAYTISTLTTYTGNTPQTGDGFARIGATGSGLTSLAPSATALSNVQWTNTLATNIGTTNTTVASNLDAAVSSRMATYTQPTGFLAATFPSGTITNNTTTPTWYTVPGTAPTVGQIATAIFTDLLSSSDFSTVGSFGKLIKDDIDATVSSRSTFAGGAVASVTAGVTVTTNNDKTGYTLTVTPPTAVENADALLGRNIAGGSSSGRIVSEAFYLLRNKVEFSGDTMTVYSTDDTTPSWTGTATTDAAAKPIVGMTPA